ncbi:MULTISPECIES: type 1 glutamine amidotransferase domain-containing protein [Streptomyces]|uniref:Type 1 glutamine amidotransferase domain-containing protein n=2 Tax=Streptomyces TaxID=1883 RepID=A0ABV1TVZ7_9ACTN|nr:type 1 glutamine amidotransferase domain-containing protein [Streptomyces sp. NBC_01764]MCX4405696.1 type 1 glutamine amidotransferase domain-containing protein [Streptomyces sp. NBC_01764]
MSDTTSTEVSTTSFDHRMRTDSRTDRVREILVVVANPTVSSNNNWPVGFWGAELTHPYYELTEAGFRVTIASPQGGRVEMDALSDPRDSSRWSAEDLITMGFLNTPELAALLEETPSLDALDLSRFEAVLIAGGQSPMFTFRDNKSLHHTIRAFWDAEKIVAAYCHGVAALVDCDLEDGSALVAGRTVTGYSNVEEDYIDRAAGVQITPWRVEDALRERGANYVGAGLFKAFAVRDGRLITGQQQYSSRKVAQAVIAAIGV